MSTVVPFRLGYYRVLLMHEETSFQQTEGFDTLLRLSGDLLLSLALLTSLGQFLAVWGEILAAAASAVHSVERLARSIAESACTNGQAC